MKVLVALFSLVAVAMARLNLIQLSPQSIQASAAALASASSSPHRVVQIIPALPLGPNHQLMDRLEAAGQVRAQRKIISGPNSLLADTRQAQSPVSVNSTGASSISSARVIELPQLNAARIAQQQAIAARQA